MTRQEVRYSVTQISKFIGIAIMLITVSSGLLAIGAKIECMKSGMIMQHNEIVQTKVELSDQRARFAGHCEQQRENEEKICNTMQSIERLQSVQTEIMKRVEIKVNKLEDNMP